MIDPSRLVRRLSLLSISFSMVFLSFGCAGPSTSLTVTSIRSHQSYQQEFSKAYAGRSEQGDFDVVLVREDRKDGPAGGIRQVMHVRVLWKPMKGTKLDHPTATNATIDWYVFGDRNQPGMVAYTGAGFVNVQSSGGVATLDIRNATLTPTIRDGAMIDPIGPARLQGTVVARAGSGERVRELLAQAREASSQANPARNAAAREASSRAPVEP